MTGPYAQAAPALLAAGWNPIPMNPASNKSTPPKGFTGYRGRAVTAADVARWVRERGAAHVGIRMPAGIVGIDVDHYGDKRGADEIGKIEAELGVLPATWASTARGGDGCRSGIWLYRIPAGVRFPTRPCPDVEFIQAHHRLAVVSPSTHHTGSRYQWYEPNGAEAGRCPDVDELAELPWPWVEHFARRGPSGAVADAATTEQVAAFVDRHTEARRPASLKGITTALAAAEGDRHDVLIEHACWAMREAAAGRFSAAAGIDALAAWWSAEDAKRARDDGRRLDADEFADALAFAVAQADAEPERIAKMRAEDDATAGTGELFGNLPESFWQARPALDHVRRAAWSRARSADAFLGAVLARVAALTNPRITLPAITGAPSSLSLYVALVGASGTGKSSTVAAVAELLPYEGDRVADNMPLGSGEGLIELFFDLTDEVGTDGKPRKVKRQTRHGAFVSLDEGQALAELGSRKGSTLLPMLRTAWTGATLGTSNASTETKRKLPAGSYSLGMVIGFQPSKAADLLADSAGGTPQRFEWVSCTDPGLPDELPDWPGPLRWTHPALVGFDGTPTTITVPTSITDPIRAHARRLTRGEVAPDEMDSHAVLARLKVAALFAVLDGRTNITDDDFELSGEFQRVSHRVRAVVLAAVDIERRKATDAQTRRYVEREDAVGASVVNMAVERMAKAIGRHVHRATCEQGCTRRCATQATAGRDRQTATIDEAIERATALRWVRTEGEHLVPGDARLA